MAWDICKSSFLTGCSEDVCATYAQIICASSYQAMYKLLCDSWGYLIVLDIGHAQGMLYLDLQVQFCTKHKKLANIHIIAILLFTNKTAETQFNLCSKIMDMIDLIWRTKLVFIGTDGKRTIMGRVSRVQTRFKAEAKYSIMRIWSGLH